MTNDYSYDTITNIIKNNCFLPSWHVKKYNYNFLGTDSEELFNKNLKTHSDDWYYRTSSITYTCNKHGYRTEEFDDIDWANSIVLFGCSNVFGIGVDDEYTISSQLSKLINKPVINMGIGGSSMTFSLHNAIILRELYPIPLAVINLWTEYSRTVYYYKNDVYNAGPWNIDNNNYFKEWIAEDSHAQTHAIFASKTSKLLWEDTKYFECSIFKDTANLLNCKFYGRPYINSVTDARDGIHYGNSTQYETAVKLAEQLQL